MRHAVFLVTPKFYWWPIQVARELKSRHPGLVIDALATVTHDKVEFLRSTGIFGQIFRLDELERGWLSKDTNRDQANRVKEIPPAILNATVVSDRHLGAGYVMEAIMEPTPLAEAAQDPIKLHQYLEGLYGWCDDIVTDKTDLVFCYCVAGAPAFALATTAQQKGASFRQLTPGRIDDLYMLDDSIPGLMTPVQRVLSSGSLKDEHMRDAKNWLQAYRNQPEAPEYTRSFMRSFESERKDVLRRFKAWLWLVKKRIVGDAGGTLRQPSFRSRMKQEGRRLNGPAKAIHHESFDAPDRPLDRPFVYFPLHVQPEASLHVMAPMHTSQIPLIEAIAKSLPLGYDLVVKEHAPMLGARPAGFYEALSRIPSVRLVHPSLDSRKLVQAAKIVFTITGTVAWESAVANTPAVTFGLTPWKDIGLGVHHVPCLEDLPTVVERLLSASSSPNDDAIVKFVAAAMQEGFHLPGDIYWGKVTEETVLSNPELLRNMVAGLEASV